MVPDSFSRFIFVHWTRTILQYANNMVPGSFSCVFFATGHVRL